MDIKGSIPVFIRSLLLVLLGFGLLGAQTQPGTDLKATIKRLQEAALVSEVAYTDLGGLCDRIGSRPSGSPSYTKAVEWALERMKAYRLQNVHSEKVMVRHWVRGAESAELLQPRPLHLNLIGLGGTAPTPRGGITAEVVVVGSRDELNQLPETAVKGRILLFDAPFVNVHQSLRYLALGHQWAAAKGAIACLVRSVTPARLGPPHTGYMNYAKGGSRLPAAALTVEDSELLHDMAQKGEKVVLHLELNSQTLPEAENPNVIAEIPGREKPGEVVVICGHLDSHDVGQGAQDDGVGCVLSIETARLIQELKLRPRRTIRVVLFADEESSDLGGKAYQDAHEAELSNHQAMVESDFGQGLIQSFSLEMRTPSSKLTQERAAALITLQGLMPLLEPLGVEAFREGFSGYPIDVLVERGVPGIGANHNLTGYWETIHSSADTFEKVKKENLQRNAAILTTLVYALAEMPERLPNAVAK